MKHIKQELATSLPTSLFLAHFGFRSIGFFTWVQQMKGHLLHRCFWNHCITVTSFLLQLLPLDFLPLGLHWCMEWEQMLEQRNEHKASQICSSTHEKHVHSFSVQGALREQRAVPGTQKEGSLLSYPKLPSHSWSVLDSRAANAI